MNSKPEKLEDLDEYLVTAVIAGRKRLGILGVVALQNPSGENKKYAMFYDFVQNEQEPLMPVGVISSTQEIDQHFGPWQSFFDSQPDLLEWTKQVDLEQPITPLSIARVYLCSTGKIQLPDSEALIQQTLSQQSPNKPSGFYMSPELIESWFQWALQEDENSRNHSRARKQLSQAIADAANQG